MFNAQYVAIPSGRFKTAFTYCDFLTFDILTFDCLTSKSNLLVHQLQHIS